MTTSNTTQDFESLYLASREKENRLYTDEQLAFLPSIESGHVHYNEWQVRKRSATRLCNYLQGKHKPSQILEVGCGNGWLAAKLSAVKNIEVSATDVNKKELAQAKRVFSKKENIQFISGDIRQPDFNNKKFDVILFAASIQYFPSFQLIINRALELLKNSGEIHIIDSKFYPETELSSAKKRSISYYRTIGFEEMAEFYYHHSFQQLRMYNYKIMFDPAALKNRLFHKEDPFPWIVVHK